MPDELTPRRQRKCAQSREGHKFVGADTHVRVCEKCGLVVVLGRRAF